MTTTVDHGWWLCLERYIYEFTIFFLYFRRAFKLLKLLLYQTTCRERRSKWEIQICCYLNGFQAPTHRCLHFRSHCFRFSSCCWAEKKHGTIPFPLSIFYLFILILFFQFMHFSLHCVRKFAFLWLIANLLVCLYVFVRKICVTLFLNCFTVRILISSLGFLPV